MLRMLLCLFAVGTLPAVSPAQTPQPFPRAGGTAQGAQPAPAQPQPRPAQGAVQKPSTPPAGPAVSSAPSAAEVGFPVYPNSQFLGSYDAGKGQRYYLFGSTMPYLEVVKYYQTTLRDRGDEVYDTPGTHMFSQRFREESMAFPPGVTVKNWVDSGSQGYPNPTLGGTPARFPTVVMIVPPPPQAAGAR